MYHDYLQSGVELTQIIYRQIARLCWQKLMKKALEEKIIDERFRFHDIRRKTSTDIEQSKGREQARQLLGHSDQKTTGIYISGIHKVKPLM